jgi:polygalacturonase
MDHGANLDGKTLNTAPLNQLVSEVSAAGGGTVYFPAGTYLTGTIYLKSGVTLYLDDGATIVGSTNLADYPENQPPRPGAQLEWGRYALISACNQHDIAIVGQGHINGQGSHPNFTKADLIARGWNKTDAYLKRPYGLSFVRCRNVTVRGIELDDIAFWCEDYLDCEDVVVDGVAVYSMNRDHNNDGIDIDGSRNVRVSNCHFVSGDDSICLKASYRDCEDVVVTNCICTSSANGVKLGTASYGGFKNIAVSNIVLNGIGASGIALETVDGGTLDGVALSNFTMNDVGTAIFLRLGDRGKLWASDSPKRGAGALRNVTIDNIVARVRGRSICSSITGLPGHPVENVSINNVRIVVAHSPARAEVEKPGTPIPEVESNYPENGMFGPLPAYGLFARHVRGLTLRGVDLGYAGSEYRSALVCQDVADLVISGLVAQAIPDAQPALLLADVRDATITGTVINGTAAAFLRAEGNTSGVTLLGNDLSHCRTPISLAQGMPAAAVSSSTNRE